MEYEKWKHSYILQQTVRESQAITLLENQQQFWYAPKLVRLSVEKCF